MERYNMIKLGNGFFVTDSRSTILKALTHDGTTADINNPAQTKYFNLTQAQAEALENHLNR